MLLLVLGGVKPSSFCTLGRAAIDDKTYLKAINSAWRCVGGGARERGRGRLHECEAAVGEVGAGKVAVRHAPDQRNREKGKLGYRTSIKHAVKHPQHSQNREHNKEGRFHLRYGKVAREELDARRAISCRVRSKSNTRTITFSCSS